MNIHGWFKTQRSIQTWTWWHDPKCVKLFIYLIANANVEPVKWGFIQIPRGSLVRSVQTICEDTQMTSKEVRNRLDWFQESGEIVVSRSMNKTLITIVKYKDFQSPDGSKQRKKPAKQTPQAVEIPFSQDTPGANEKAPESSLKREDDKNLTDSKGKRKASQGQTEGKPRANQGQQIKNNKNKEELKRIIKQLKLFNEYPENFSNVFLNCLWMFTEEMRPDNTKALEQWATVFEQLHRLDGHEPDHIMEIVRFARLDSFWSTNVLSMLKLRRKDVNGLQWFRRLEIEKGKTKHHGNNKTGGNFNPSQISEKKSVDDYK